MKVAFPTRQLLASAGASLAFALGAVAPAQGQTGSIAGSVWNDLSANGVREPGEPALESWQVELIDFDGDVIAGDTTDASGNYQFDGLTFGPYIVRQAVQPGWRQTTPSFNTQINITPVSGVWDYDDDDSDGAVGPDHWITIAPDAGGNFQTPVNIAGTPPIDLSPYLSVHYPGTGLEEVIVRGSFGRPFNVEAEYEPDNENHITLAGKDFNLVQFHFHKASEHEVDGQLKPMELHLVHRHANGGLAVLGLLIEEGQENQTLNPFFEAIKNIGSGIGDHVELEETIDLEGLIPDNMSGWFYNGSLTTPPASEGVNWFVFEDTLELSLEQIEAFEAFLQSIDLDHNNRPIEPLNGRQFNQLNFQVTLNDEAGIGNLQFGDVIPEPASGLLFLGAVSLFTTRRRTA